MQVAETKRLIIRWLQPDDAGFILELVNQPGWIEFIGDKDVRKLLDATKYLDQGPLAMYREHGHGLYAVLRKQDQLPVGICGLIKRYESKQLDLGFAFLADYCGRGYGYESASAVIDYARGPMALKQLVAFTKPNNSNSIHLLEKLGFAYLRPFQLLVDSQPSRLYGLDL